MDAIEQQREQLLEDVQTLPVAVLQEASDFIAQLRQKSAESKTAQGSEQATSSPYEVLKESGFIGCAEDPSDLSANHKKYLEEGWKEKHDHRPSLQEIARLPLHERHKLLEKTVAEIAEDFAHDPALTEFSEA
jgi:hypothetical protein